MFSFTCYTGECILLKKIKNQHKCYLNQPLWKSLSKDMFFFLHVTKTCLLLHVIKTCFLLHVIKTGFLLHVIETFFFLIFFIFFFHVIQDGAFTTKNQHKCYLNQPLWESLSKVGWLLCVADTACNDATRGEIFSKSC